MKLPQCAAVQCTNSIRSCSRGLDLCARLASFNSEVSDPDVPKFSYFHVANVTDLTVKEKRFMVCHYEVKGLPKSEEVWLLMHSEACCQAMCHS